MDGTRSREDTGRHGFASVHGELSRHGQLFAYGLIGAMFVYGYPLTNFAFHIDEEMSAVYGSVEQNIGLGRWGIAFVRSFLVPDPVVPFFLPVVSILLIAAAAVLAAHTLHVSRFQQSVFVLLFISFPQFAYQLEFLNQADCVAFGIACAVIAHVIVSRGLSRHRRLPVAAAVGSIVLLVTAMSFYQSIIFVFSTLCILTSLSRTIASQASIRSVAWEISAAFVVVVIAYLLCAAINKSVQHHSGISQEDFQIYANYLDSMIGWKHDPWHTALHNLLTALLDDVRGGWFYGNAMYATVWVPVLAIVALALASDFSIQRRVLIAVLAIALAVSPFVGVVLLGRQQAPRTFVAEQIAFAGLWTVGFAWGRTVWPVLVAPWLAAALVTFSLLFGSLHVSRMFFADTMSWEADKLLGGRIVDAIYRTDPAFDERATAVYFSGAYAAPNIWKSDDFDVFGQSFFAWDGGNPMRINAFLRASGIASLRLPNPAERAAAEPAIAVLPSWPNPGSVQVVQGVVVVKLGGR